MRTWENYKKQAKDISPLVENDIIEMETLAVIVSSIIKQRTKLGYSQRELAELCDVPQSTIARLEACIVSPNIETLVKIMRPLGLKIVVSPVEE